MHWGMYFISKLIMTIQMDIQINSESSKNELISFSYILFLYDI